MNILLILIYTLHIIITHQFLEVKGQGQQNQRSRSQGERSKSHMKRGCISFVFVISMKLKGELLPEGDVRPFLDQSIEETHNCTEDIGKCFKFLPLMVSEE